MPLLTPQQERAVTTRGVSVVLASGAGCGKTHVLTERYLSHLLVDGAEVSQIVAITFTDRAARQMRGRIREVLAQRLRQSGSDDEAAVWARHLRGLESAPISTIHAFCGTLLRQHSVEAGVDARFDVLEEVLAVNLQVEALQLCLQNLLTASADAGEDLRQLVLRYGYRSVVEGVQHLLHSWDEERWVAWLQRSETDVADEWREQARKHLLPRYVEYLLGGRPAIARCLSLLKRHPPLPGPMVENVRLIQEKLPRLAEAPDLEQAVKELTEAAKVKSGGSKAWPDADVYEQIKDAFTDFREELRNQHLEHFTAPTEGLEEAIDVGRQLVRVVREVQRTYADRKRLHGVVDFQDLIVLTRELLRKHADVRAELQERFRFVLMDEAQDTDPVQMELLTLLCGARRTEGKLFAVGDANQSIYRFRGADVQLFQELRQNMPHEGRLGLTVNFRSQPAILDFANALLGHRLADFEPLQGFHPQVNPEPCIEFLWSPRPEKATAAQERLAEADWIGRRLLAMIGREALVVNREEAPEQLRPVKAGDIVLLFRAMSNVPLYEAALRQYGLDYYLVGGRAFFAQQEIYDLLNLLRALENPQAGVSLAGTLRSPFCCLSDEALFVLGRHKEGLWTGLNDVEREAQLPADQRERVRRARGHLRRWRAVKDRLPIARLLGAVFADSGFDASTQLEYMAERKLANLWKLLDLARTFDRSGLFGLAEFIARLGDLVKSQSREEQAATQPENADVIRLMSIHQAKGLEFPVVVIPDMMARGGGNAHPIAEWDDQFGCVARPPSDQAGIAFPDCGWQWLQAQNQLEEWREDLRILYVACTRARDYLILSSSVPEPIVPVNAWMLTLLERFDPRSGACLVADIPPERRPHVVVYNQLHPPPEPVSRAQPMPTGPPTVLDLPDARPALTVFHPPPMEQALDEDCGVAPWARKEQVMRSVLAAWEFADPEGWQPLLAALTSGWEPESVNILVDGFQRLAASALGRELAVARNPQREVDYLLRLGPDAPVVRGRIDLLCQDAEGHWQILLYVWRNLPNADGERLWKEHEEALTLAAAAWHDQMGAWPREVGLLVLPSAMLIRKAGRHLPHRRVRAEAAKRLRKGKGIGLFGEY
jgi:ATP-dependent helicase/nuclease subunit A